MKKSLSFLVILAIFAGLLAGCTDDPTQVAMKEQNHKKAEQAVRLMKDVAIPPITHSQERENIAERIIKTNNPATLQWIYLIDNGRVLFRGPVRGKVTSGNKRLTSTQQLVEENNTTSEQVMEAPDEMGTYGSSNQYIFWFDPAGSPHQWQGNYFLSMTPYKIDMGYSTIVYELDNAEEDNRATYNQQIEQSLAERERLLKEELAKQAANAPTSQADSTVPKGDK